MSETGCVLLSLAVCAFAYAGMQRLAMRLAAGDRKAAYSGPPLAGDFAAALVGVQIASLFLVVTGRPGMSALLALSLVTLLLALNRAKERVLREPLVLADAWLLPQVWKYPEMYIPFLPVKGILAATGGVVMCLGALMWAEAGIPYVGNGALYGIVFMVAVIPVIGLILLRRLFFSDRIAQVLLHHLPVSHNAAADAARNGALAAALMHPVLAGRMERNKPDFMRDAFTRPEASRWPGGFEAMLREVEEKPLDECPHVLLIQAESFCDIREHLKGEQREALKDFLPNWDKLKAMGRTLPTPENAYGAYTMRTEFSKLTGLEMDELGAFAFNPYLLAARQPMWSLARFFRDKGYETVCMHPYHKGFFRRDKVMPNLGFERFLGIEELGELERFGPYVSDLALGERILRELEASARPVFCFAITMEAHGPWTKGRFTEEEKNEMLILTTAKEQHCIALQMYLWHLKHLDLLFYNLLSKKLTRSSEIWPYGDHAPYFIK